MKHYKKADIKKLIKLFVSMLYISAFTFGGGFVIVTLMKKKFADEYKWLDEQEMLDITSIAQSTPGPIALNAAVIAGKKIGGAWGIFAAALGTIIPPFVIISVISVFYSFFADNRYIAIVLKGMQAGVAAVIIDVSCSLSKNYFKNKKIFEIILIIISFIFVFFVKINVIYILLAAALIGVVSVIAAGRKAAEK